MERICKQCNNKWTDGKRSSLCPDCRTKLGKRNKRKGNANELRFAQYLNSQFQKYGFKYIAKRTPRSGGIQDFEPADIMFKFVPTTSIFNKLHFENKNTAQWDIENWHAYALEKELETGRNREPVIMMRKPSKREEYAVTSKEFFVKLLLDIDALRNEQK